MPHKKAKYAVREKTRNERGEDLPPGKDSIQNESIPKSALRVLNALAIRNEYKQRKRKNEDNGDRPMKKQKSDTSTKDGKKATLTIQPGESLQHFNRRVEDDLRPLVKAAAQSSRAVARKVDKEDRDARKHSKTTRTEDKGDSTKSVPKPAARKQDNFRDSTSPEPTSVRSIERPKEFQKVSTSAPRRLNDIVQAPPELKKLPRGADTVTRKREGVLSMSQKLMMEQEREKAIVRYRELKTKRLQQGAHFNDKLGDKA